ncbi:unnamed protein product, partial [Mesorhabditis belari]|uniref:BTB domain-containing protein n=1 Tax=Mesorhabditis belari TaxID=2138241 RepID=A0AAF3J1I7_9BILA
MNSTKSEIHFSILTDEEQDEHLVKHNASHFIKAFQQLNELRRDGAFCDVCLITSESRRISVHKLVLAATIPYFRAMFSVDMMEASSPEIHLREISFETLNQMVTYAYTGELRITASNVENVMLVANYLGLCDIVTECATFLAPRLHVSNVLAIDAFCRTIGCKSILENIRSYINSNFVAVTQSHPFLELSLEEIQEILIRDELYVGSEENVFHAAIRWIEFDQLERRQHISKLLRCVRLSQLSPSVLSDTIANHSLVKNDLACRDLIDDAKDYHLMPERRAFLKSRRFRARSYEDAPGIIVAVGGSNQKETAQTTVEMYDPRVKFWQPIKPMGVLRTRVGVTCHNGKLYAIGGYDGKERLKLVEVYNYEKNDWSTLAPLFIRRSAPSAAFLNGLLYVCGGHDGSNSLDNVEIYHPEKNEWMHGPPMNCSRSTAGIVSLDGYLYVIGGHDGITIFNTVERYCPEKKEWEKMPPLLNKRCRLGATVLNRKIYVCGGYDGSNFLSSVEVFDPVRNEWSPVTPMMIKRSNLSTTVVGKQLYAVAGSDGISNLSSVEMYSEETDEWSLVSPMIAHEGGRMAGAGESAKDFLIRCMQFDSSTGKEGEYCTFLASVLRADGWEVLEQFIGDNDRRNLLATRGPINEVKVLLNTHLDQVPPYIPPTEDEINVYGRASNETKGQLSAIVLAANRFAKEYPELSHKVGLLFVVGEEVDHIGMIKANELDISPDYMIVGEPTESAFASIQKGVLKVHVKTQGKAGHSGYPHTGTSAIHKLLDVLHDIMHHNWPKSDVHGDTTLNVGLINGGHALNAWAEKAQASIFFRVTTSVNDVKSQLEKIVGERADLDYSLGGNDPVTFAEPPFPAKRLACSFNTDLPYYKKKDQLKGAFMYGAGSITNAFSADEFIPIDDLNKALETYYRLLVTLLHK